MRRILNILSILILLTLGVELMSARGVGMQGRAPLMVCIVDDDADGGKGEETLHESVQNEPGFSTAFGLQALIHSMWADLYSSFDQTAIQKACPRVRLHRWFCKECC